MNIRFNKLVHWGLFLVIVIEIVTGYGISQYRVVEMLTFGILTKALSFKLHSFFAIPAIVLLVLHIWIVVGRRIRD